MGLVQCFVVVLMLSTQLALTSPVAEVTQYYILHGRRCKMCPAGEYQKSCTECEPCPAGRYTTEWNREDSCHLCYRDCRPDFHLKVVQNCTSKSDVRCICEAGFRCTDMVTYSANCKYCEKIQETTTNGAAAIIPGKEKQTPPSTSSGHSSTTAEPCQLPDCGSQPILPTGIDTPLKKDKMSSPLAAILCSVAAIGCAALVILFFIRRPGHESCFKQAVALLVCNEGVRDTSHKSKESAQFPQDSFSAKQQPSSLSAANLGPVHVHNPGTVIFSLLSQFTGQIGPTIEGGKTARRESVQEDDERDCPVYHPTSSPSIHLSEEERSGEIDRIFFPSQEQGKDCHVSKEEVL